MLHLLLLLPLSSSVVVIVLIIIIIIKKCREEKHRQYHNNNGVRLAGRGMLLFNEEIKSIDYPVLALLMALNLSFRKVFLQFEMQTIITLQKIVSLSL